MIQNSSIQEVMNRADLAEVVEKFVRLKKRGSNYIANCPFHNEKTPSFVLSPSKGIYKCFGCGKGGNVVTFLQDHEKLSYPEAIRWLADYYKIPLEETVQSDEQKQLIKEEEKLRVIAEFASQWFHEQMLHTEEGKTIGYAYFKERDLRQHIIESFRLGYCPESGKAFYEAAIAKGFDATNLEKLGLVKQRNGQYYDAYKGRVIFPIQNLTGRVVGFGARVLKSTENAPKYINSPENELYNKSKVLYGLFQARQSIAKEDVCLLTEGYMDVLALHQGGITNAVASSGTALTEDQLRLIARVTRNMLILYDGDSAGVKAAIRGMELAMGQGMFVHLVLFPEGQDPDSYIKEKGEAAFREYIQQHKRDPISFRIEANLSLVENDPVAKTKLVNEVAETISLLNRAEDFALQEHYIRNAAQSLAVDEKGLTTLVNQYIRKKIEGQERRSFEQKKAAEVAEVAQAETELGVDVPVKDYNEEQEWQLIKVLITLGDQDYENHQHVAEFLYTRIDPELIESPGVRRLYEIYYEFVAEYQILPAIKYFIHHPEEVFQRKLGSLLQERFEVSPRWKSTYGIETFHGEKNYINDVNSTVQYYEWKKLKAQLIQLLEELKTEKDPARLAQLQQLYITLKAQEKELLERNGTVIIRATGLK